MFVEFRNSLREASSEPEKQQALIDQLWYRTFFLGGVLFSTNENVAGVYVGHLAYLISFSYQGEKLFLLSDPEISSYKLIDRQLFIKMATDPKVNFDLMDVR